MFKTKMFATLTLVLAAVAILSTVTLARNAFAAGGDDVFMDEGDGDFDSVPAPPTEAKSATVPKAAEPRPAEAPVEQHDEIPVLVDDSSAPAATPAPTEDPSQPATAAPKETKSKKKKPAKKAAASASNEEAPAESADEAAPAPKAHHHTKASGSFVVTKDACPMMRSPASTGETMLTVKASKKIWVEDAGDGWVKAFNKAGEPGYVSKDCF